MIKIDSAKRRLGLSLKRVDDQEYADYDQSETEEWNEDQPEGDAEPSPEETESETYES